MMTSVSASETIEAMRDGVGIADLNMQITAVNKACSKMFGYEKDEIIGKSVTKLFVERERAIIMKRAREDLETGISMVSVYIGLKKDGTEFPVQISVSMKKDENGKPIEFIVVLRDMTELKRAQEKELAVATAEERAKAESARKKIATLKSAAAEDAK